LQKLCTKIKKVNCYLARLWAMLTVREMGKAPCWQFLLWGRVVSLQGNGGGYNVMKLYSTFVYERIADEFLVYATRFTYALCVAS